MMPGQCSGVAVARCFNANHGDTKLHSPGDNRDKSPYCIESLNVFLPDLFPLHIPQHMQALPIRYLHRAGSGLPLFSEAASVSFKNTIAKGGTMNY